MHIAPCDVHGAQAGIIGLLSCWYGLSMSNASPVCHSNRVHDCLIVSEGGCWAPVRRRAKEHEGVIGEKDRAAMAAQGQLREYQRGIAPMEDELANIRRCGVLTY